MSDLLANDKFAELFWSKVAIGNPMECWPWKGQISWDSYGSQNYPTSSRDPDRVQYHAHKLAYWLSYGPVDKELVVDHICHTTVEECGSPGIECPHRRCCNPFHLVTTTRLHNTRRSKSGLCKNGHVLDDVGRNGRSCRLCFNKWHRDYEETKRRNAGKKEIGPYQKALGRNCSHNHCYKPVRCKGLCGVHYKQSRKGQ